MSRRLPLLLCFVLCFAVKLCAQQTSGYIIRNYDPKLFEGFNQTWCAVQDRSGVMYFGGASEIFVYNGQDWNKIFVKAGVAIRALQYDSVNNIIYVGAVGEFGKLVKNSKGKYQYESLSEKLPETWRSFADVWSVSLWNNAVVFHTSERIYFYRNGNFEVVKPARNTFALAFPADKRLFVRERRLGLMEVTGTILQLLPGGEQFADEPILSIIPWEKDKNIILTGDHGIYVMNAGANGFESKPITDDYLLNSGVLGAKWINDTTICIYSRSGIAFYNNKLQLLETLDKNDGIMDESVANVFVDREYNLWLTTNYGITRVGYSMPDRYLGTNSGLEGTINYVSRFEDAIYVATTSGIFSASKTAGNGKFLFEVVDMPKTETWCLTRFGNKLLAGTSNGLYNIAGKKSFRLTENVLNDISLNSSDKNDLMLCEKGGLRYMHADGNGNLQEVHYYPFASTEFLKVSDLVPNKKNPDLCALWAVTREKEIYFFQFNKRTGAHTFRKYNRGVHFDITENLSPFVYNDSVYFFSPYKTIRFVPGRDNGKQEVCFAEAPDISAKIKRPENQHLLAGDISFLFFHEVESKTITLINPDDKKGLTKVIISEFVGEDIICYMQDKNGLIWLCATSDVIRYDSKINKNDGAGFAALLTGFGIGDSIVFSGAELGNIFCAEKIPYAASRYSFSFAAPFFDHETETRFSYRLLGYDTAWAAWTGETDIQFSNLHEGDYIFEVKALNIFGHESKTASYHFTILPPWYRTGWAYAGYVLLFAALVYLLVRISIRRLRHAKVRLEKIVTERTRQVVKQKAELEVAYKDIRDSIEYAKRIQEAMLPLEENIEAFFPDHFILLYPRNIVSGDFYWFTHREDLLILVCADCTGHGVPGALMSMIGNSLLNEIVFELKITDPGAILEELHLRVRHSLKQDKNNDTRDGMDIAICVLNNKTGAMTFAGANRPLFIIRAGALTEIDPDKYSIGGFQTEEKRVYNTRQTQLEKGDCVYLFTDGYPDQFGGPKGKKFMIKRLREQFLNIYGLPMKEQRAILDKSFLDWKKNDEQTDDVLVIGFRF